MENILEKYGFTKELLPVNAEGIAARVTAVHRERYELVCEYGEVYGRLKTKNYYGQEYSGVREEFPTTGDFVTIRYNPAGDSQILQTLPRKTFFSRKDPTPGRGEQAVAANFDYCFLMQSMNQNFNEKRLERYLTLAWQSGAIPVVILSKADLQQEHAAYISKVQRVAAGVAIHAVSARTGEGLDALKPYTASGKTLVFLGSSGVGKSSLVNALAGEELMAVKEIREEDGKGRHTTTHRQLIMLQCGAMIIDTPGMRELGMWDVTTGLGEAFGDVEQFLGQCRFRDCKHQTEPGCAIRAAIESGELSAERWNSYSRLQREARYSAAKEGMLRHKEEKFKKIAEANKQRKRREMRETGQGC